MKFFKYILTFALVCAALAVWGQAPDGQAAPPATEQTKALSSTMLYILIGTAAMLFFAAMFYMVRVNQILYKRALTLQAAASNVSVPALENAVDEAIGMKEDFLTRLRKKYWEDAVPVEREHEIMSHHAYDGIHELDNSLPPWWINMFILTAIYAAIYMFYYHFGGGGPSLIDEYNQEMEKAKQEQAIALAGLANAIDESNVVALTESGAISEGQTIYKTNCAACHGQLGEGLVGPNFTDEYWVHGGGIKNIFKTIKYGVPEKGMIAWQAQLKPSDMQKVSSYILTLQGTNPPNQKEPQGEIWKEEAPQDSTNQAAPAGTTAN